MNEREDDITKIKPNPLIENLIDFFGDEWDRQISLLREKGALPMEGVIYPEHPQDKPNKPKDK